MNNELKNEEEKQISNDDLSQNRFKMYLESNPVRGSFILIGLSMLIVFVTYYDYFLNGDDYVFIMLPPLIVAMIFSTIFFIVSAVVKKIKEK